jgi:hypothetical protein
MGKILVAVMGDVFILMCNFHAPLALKVEPFIKLITIMLTTF